MNGASTGGSPRGLRDLGSGDAAPEGARGPGGKAAAGKAAARANPEVDGDPDFTAALVVAGTAGLVPVQPILPKGASPDEAGPAEAAAPIRSRPDADRPRPTADRAALELKLPDDALAGRSGNHGGEPRRAAADGTEAPAGPPSRPDVPVALDDRNLSGAVLPGAAHLSLDAGPAGEIGLHLRVREGIADVRIDGSLAPLAEARSAELRLALAREGLQLGSLELSGHGDPSRQHGAPDRPEPAETGPGAVAAPVSPPGGEAPASPREVRGTSAGGRIHVEA